MTKVPRLAIARVWHEANSFSPVRTRLADFRHREWSAGEDAVRFYRATRTEIGAAVDFAAVHPDLQLVFLHCCAAPPGGVVEEAAAAQIRERILDGLASGAGRWDAVYLSLHGAMIAEDDVAFELGLLRAVRAIAADAPIAATFDLHANLAPGIADCADIVCGYKTYPHVDMYETAQRALSLLERTVRGALRPVSAIVKVGAILASHNMRTAAGPMRAIEDEAQAVAARRGALDVTPFGGFTYGDSPHAGASVSAVMDGRGAAGTAQAAVRAREAAAEVATYVAAVRSEFEVSLPSAAEGVRRALAIVPVPGKPIAILEPSDNPLSGGAGDTTGLLRAMLEHAAGVPSAFAFFCDPPLVARAHAAGEGSEIDCRLGGRVAPVFGDPMPLRVRVGRLTDGRFVNEGPMEAGLAVDIGRTAVLVAGSMRIVVTQSCQSPNDPAWFALHGIELASIRLLAAKAKNHFRAAFESRCTAIVDVDTPGPATADWRRLPFRLAPPPLLR